MLGPIVTRTLNLAVEANPRQVQRGRELADARDRHRALLRVDHRRFAVSELHDCAGRERAAGRPQPRRISRRSTSRCRPRRSCGATIRRRSPTSPSSSSRTRSRTSGGARRSAGGTTTSSGSARASRSTSPRCTRSSARRRGVRGVLRQMRAWAIDEIGSGTGVPRISARAHPRRKPRVPRAGLQQGRAVLHMLRRLIGDEAFFRGLRRFYATVAVPQGRHRGLARGDGGGERAARSTASSSAGSTGRRCRS